MKKIRKTVLTSIALLFLIVFSGTTYAGGEIKIALDCPPDPDQCGTYLWSKTFSDFLKTVPGRT